MNSNDVIAFTLGDVALPETSIEMASTLLLDTLGVAAGAAQMQAGRIARDHAVRFHSARSPQDSATLPFDGRKASIPGVAFAAATQIDNLDAHDGFNPCKGHIGCAVVPALCAFGESNPDLLARDALAALVISYEVSARAGLALHASVSDYHTSGAWNALGVAALGCRLRGANAETLEHALGIAEYHGPRSQMMREIANPTMLHDGSGMGALTGSMAVLMAEDGFEGAPAITVFTQDVAAYWQDLGDVWTVEENYIKPYPICRWSHAAIDALAKLIKEHGFSHNDIEAIEVRAFAEAAALFKGIPTTTSQAQYSLAFAMAVRLVHGQIGPKHIASEGFQDKDVAKVVGLISVSQDIRHSDRFPSGRWSDVMVKLKSGAFLSSGDVHARGGQEAPMSLAEIEAKFKNFTYLLSTPRSDALWAMRDRLLEPDTKFSELLSLLSEPVEPNHDR
jgi:2-methylcitrate dehydratase PrpD